MAVRPDTNVTKIFSLKRYKNFVLLLCLFVFFVDLPNTQIRAEEDGGGRKRFDFAVDYGAGFPHLLSYGFTYMRFNKLHFGFVMGSMPELVNLVKPYLPYNLDDAISIAGSGLGVKVNASANMSSYWAFLRFYPWGGKFAFELAYSTLNLSMGASGTIVSTTSSSGGISAGGFSFTFNQPFLSTGIAWKWMARFGLFADLSLGALFLQNPSIYAGLGGTITSVSGILDAVSPGQGATVSTQISDVQSQIDTYVTQLRALIKNQPVLPYLSIRLGWAFDVF